MIEQIKKNHFFFATVLLVLVLPVDFLVVPCIVILIVSWLFSDSFQIKVQRLRSNKAILIFILPFFAYLFGMIYSDNQAFGWGDIEIKVSLLIFPITMGTSRRFNSKEKDLLLQAFILSMCFYAIFSLTAGALTYHQIPTYTKLNALLHPGYLAMYMCFAVIGVFYQIDKVKGFSKVLMRIAFITLSVTTCLTLSKVGLLIWVIIVVVFVVFNLFVVKRQYLKTFILIVFSFLLIVTVFKFLPELNERLYWANEALKEKKEEDNSTTESTKVRLLIWGESWKIIKEKPLFGTGTGDIKDELFIKYEANGMTGALEKKLNVHNQFLQVLTTLGVVGFFVFLLNFLYPFYFALRQRQYLYVFFLMLIALNFLIESMLEKQDGVVFYAFLNSLLFFQFKPEEEKVNLKS